MCILQRVWCHHPRIWLPAPQLNLTYLDSSLESVIREPALYRLLTFMSIFSCIDRLSQESIHSETFENFEGRSYFTTDSQSVCLGIEHPCGTCDQILFPVGMLLSEICGFVSIGRPLWREDGSAICSVITQLSDSLRTRNHTLLSYLRLPQPGGPYSRIYIPQEQGGPVITPAMGLKIS
jgi:hypothetical protein